MKIETKDSEGKPNGYLIPIWSALERPELRPEQVYLTAIAPRSRKGPHLHNVRRGVFSVLSGRVIVQVRLLNGTYSGYPLWPGQPIVMVAPGTPCALYNYGDREALVLNMPSPAWSKEAPDDWPVEDWEDPKGWNW